MKSKLVNTTYYVETIQRTPTPFFSGIFSTKAFCTTAVVYSLPCFGLFVLPGGESRRDLGTAGREILLNCSDETSGEAVGKTLKLL